MTSFSNILLALDGSAPSDAALDAACSLARDRGARITAVNVCEPRPHVHGHHVDWRGDDDAARREAFAVLRRASETATHDYGLTMETKLLDGQIVPAIVAHAQRVGADTIVIGSHGRGGLQHVLLGSVAEGLMRASPVPVLVVHAASASRAVEKDGLALAATAHRDASQHGCVAK
jgi:nucleotide-binding universal stress UspA family protein